MAPVIALAMGLAVLGLAVARRAFTADELRASNDAVGSYLQAVGTIYAVLLAFVVFVVWQQFNAARDHVAEEANAVVDLVRTAKLLPPGVRREVATQALRYVDAVLAREWAAMPRHDDDGGADGNDALEHMWGAVASFEPVAERHKTLHAHAVARFMALSDARGRRLSASRLRIPLAMRFLLFVGAAITVASVYLLAVDRVLIHALIAAGLAGAISHVLYVVVDLDARFAGDWQVSSAPLERARAYARAAAEVPEG